MCFSHITLCREWLQDPSASGAWKFHTQFLALLEYAARSSKIQKTVCCFKKTPSFSKLTASASSIKLNFAEFSNWIQIIKLSIWRLALTCKYKLLQCQQFNVTSFVCFSEAFGKTPSLFTWNYFLWLPESVQVTQSLKIMSKPLLKLLPLFCLPPLWFIFCK